jgi:hypothetical protein
MGKTIAAPENMGITPEESKVKLANNNFQSFSDLYPSANEPDTRSAAEIQIDNEINSSNDYDEKLQKAIISAHIFGAFGAIIYITITILTSLNSSVPAFVALAARLSIFLPFILAFLFLRSASKQYLRHENFPQTQKAGFIRATILPAIALRFGIISVASSLFAHAPGLIGQLIGPAIAIFVGLVVGSSVQYSFITNRRIAVDYRQPLINTIVFTLVTALSITPALFAETNVASFNFLVQLLSIIAFFIIDQLCARISVGWK